MHLSGATQLRSRMVKKEWKSSLAIQLKITQLEQENKSFGINAFDHQMKSLTENIQNVTWICQFCSHKSQDQISFAEHAFVCKYYLKDKNIDQSNSIYPEIIKVDFRATRTRSNAPAGTSTRTIGNREVPVTTPGTTPVATLDATPGTTPSATPVETPGTTPAGTSTKIIGKEKSASVFKLVDFPGQTLTKVFASLDLKDLLNCGQVSKRFRAISHDEFLWQRIDLRGQNVMTTFFQFILDRGCKYLYLYNCRLEVELRSTEKSKLKYLYLQNCQVDDESLEELLDENEATCPTKNINVQNENKTRTYLKRKSSVSLNSDQETFKKFNGENQDMNIEKIQDNMIVQGCEGDEKTSNSSTLTAFFQLPTRPSQFLSAGEENFKKVC